MERQLADHALQRLRERGLPVEAVTPVLQEPERIDTQNPGSWNERYRCFRRLGALLVVVVWHWDDDVQVVITVMVSPAPRGRRKRRL